LGVFCPVSNEYHFLVKEIKNSFARKYRGKIKKTPVPTFKKDEKKAI
jgi:hypothetical protein